MNGLRISALGALLSLACAIAGLTAPGAGASESEEATKMSSPCGEEIGNRCPGWVARYDFPAGHIGSGVGWEEASAIAASPQADHVFVTGPSLDGRSGTTDYATVAYDSVSGEQLWSRRYKGPRGRDDLPAAIAVSPDGRAVFVTGRRDSAGGRGGAFATVAYSALTGKKLWVADNEPTRGAAYDIGVSADGRTIYVVGEAKNVKRGDMDFLTVSYDVGTGRVLDRFRFNSPKDREDVATEVALSTSGRRLIVSGATEPGERGSPSIFRVIAYRIKGARAAGVAWSSTVRMSGDGYLREGDLALGHRSRAVYLAVKGADGSMHPVHSQKTVAFDLSDGKRRWTHRIEGISALYTGPPLVAASLDGSKVFTSGLSAEHGDSEVTVALRPSDGQPQWATRNSVMGQSNTAKALIASSDSETLYVAGYGQEAGVNFVSNPSFTVKAYSASSGQTLWEASFNTSEAQQGEDFVTAAALSADGSHIFLSGHFGYFDEDRTSDNSSDFGTVAYETWHSP